MYQGPLYDLHMATMLRMHKDSTGSVSREQR